MVVARIGTTLRLIILKQSCRQRVRSTPKCRSRYGLGYREQLNSYLRFSRILKSDLRLCRWLQFWFHIVENHKSYSSFNVKLDDFDFYLARFRNQIEVRVYWASSLSLWLGMPVGQLSIITVIWVISGFRSQLSDLVQWFFLAKPSSCLPSRGRQNMSISNCLEERTARSILVHVLLCSGYSIYLTSVLGFRECLFVALVLEEPQYLSWVW